MPAAPPDEITTAQATEVLGLTNVSTVARYVYEGKLTPSRKLPGKTGAYLFWRHEIEAFAAARAAKAAS